MFLFSLPKLKSRPAVVAVAALLLFPLSAPPAAAWESACAEFQFPKVWFDGKFRVLYGFDDIPPTHGVVDGRHKLIPDPPYNRLTGRATRADDYHLPPGHIARGAGAWSGTLRTGNKRCVSLAEVRPGEKFVVYMLPGTMPESAGVFLRNASGQSGSLLSPARPPVHPDLVARVGDNRPPALRVLPRDELRRTSVPRQRVLSGGMRSGFRRKGFIARHSSGTNHPQQNENAKRRRAGVKFRRCFFRQDRKGIPRCFCFRR